MLATFLYLSLSTCIVSTVQGKYQFFHHENVNHIKTIVSCANQTAKRLFNPERRVDVIYYQYGDLENAMVRACAKNAAITIGDRTVMIRNERIPSYIVIEHDEFSGSRGILLPGEPSLRTLQYLFVTKANGDQVRSFARDLRNAGYRDVAFLAFNDTGVGTVIRANTTGREITLRSVGSCTAFTSNVDRIPTYATDSRRYCVREGCTVKYGIVADATVRFWRKEDTLKLIRNESLQAVGGLLVEHFGDYYNITVDSSAGNSMSWPDAITKLINRDLDVIVGPRPEDLRIFDNMEIICWYMYRDMVFAGLVHFRTIQNDVLKMLMPFHYLVWLCVVLVLIFYILLLTALRKLTNMGLIKERVKFEYVFSIMLSQGVEFPRNFGLRLVLLLWIVFSFYLSATYNSTFTSSVAEVETEDLLKDVRQVRETGQRLGGPAVVLAYFNNSSDRSIKELQERYKVIGAEEALDSILAEDGIAVLQHFTVHRINWDYRGNRSLRMYALANPVLRFPVFLFTRRGYVYRRPLRQLVTRYREIGMIHKLENVTILEEDKQIALSQATDEILTMKHLRPIFEILFMCQGVSLLMLLVELLHARMLKT
ncbi:uncharacterized protein LOC128893440 [Hylaeus anthracinus]|uniref:uncharacterized protein LOC128893440 n=1 Tax=Hylaeus anthracinus TaxID=313031 RepID=UPI0023B9C337|nr:uncharacterized protein LOC128893440 [Hylaeus anthracinus]